ncbi:MAG TPA: hypothetical protein VK926_03310 [Gaiellaceae bacterium]|nr:hypothetical protein [Gaiellaceae bacterium]
MHVAEQTFLAPERVLSAACDFSERRALLWPDVHVEHLRVHEIGEAFADVTEGNPSELGLIWERMRYDWSEPGLVKGTVVDSNIFGPGSTWELRVTPTDGGSRVDLIAVRNPRGVKGFVIEAYIRLGVARRVVRNHLRHFLSTLEREIEGDARGRDDAHDRS